MFRAFLFNDLSKENVWKLEKYIKLCINTLKNYAPSKNKFTRGNPIPFINKAIMNRTRLRNVYLRKRSDEKRKKYSKQRNYCVLSLRRTKRKYCSSFGKKSIADHTKFWRTLKSFLSEKSPSDAKITLKETSNSYFCINP